MSTLTPTSSSAAIAGFGFYALIWGLFAKMNTILALFGIKRKDYNRGASVWINQNKALTLCFTEVLNFAIHGITNPAAVTFAIGGTICNACFIFIVNPLRCLRIRSRGPVAIDTRKIA